MHVALIMDGNGRWAKERGLNRSAGHKAGADNLIKLLDYIYKNTPIKVVKKAGGAQFKNQSLKIPSSVPSHGTTM